MLDFVVGMVLLSCFGLIIVVSCIAIKTINELEQL